MLWEFPASRIAEPEDEASESSSFTMPAFRHSMETATLRSKNRLWGFARIEGKSESTMEMFSAKARAKKKPGFESSDCAKKSPFEATVETCSDSTLSERAESIALREFISCESLLSDFEQHHIGFESPEITALPSA